MIEIPFPDKQYKLFCEYDEAHPEVWREFLRITLITMKVKKFKNYSARDIFPIMRWHRGPKGLKEDGFKINNNYSPFYARKFHELYPQHEGFFRTRKSKYDESNGNGGPQNLTGTTNERSS